jgi:hypothetical protein
MDGPMALDRFRASPLPNPPAQYDPQYLRQLIRVVEIYFSQLDSRAPNNAEQYSADRFVGGSFSGTSISADSLDVITLQALGALFGYVRADGVWTDALISYGHRNGAQISDQIMAGNVYADYLYGDGRFVSTPYNQLSSNQDQTAASVAVAYALTLNGDEFPNGISIVSNSRITFAQQGIYNVSYSIQFKNTTNDQQDIDIWMRYNGTDIANSNSRFTIPARKSSGNPSHLIAVTPIVVDIPADNGYVEIMWRVENTGVSIEHFPAVAASPGVTPAIPATPSAIIGITHVSAQFPAVTRVAPLPVFGFGQIGDISVVTS